MAERVEVKLDEGSLAKAQRAARQSDRLDRPFDATVFSQSKPTSPQKQSAGSR